MEFRKKDVENLKVAMVRKYGDVNFSKLARELNISRRSVYNAIQNRPYCENIKIKLKEWLLENA